MVAPRPACQTETVAPAPDDGVQQRTGKDTAMNRLDLGHLARDGGAPSAAMEQGPRGPIDPRVPTRTGCGDDAD